MTHEDEPDKIKQELTKPKIQTTAIFSCFHVHLLLQNLSIKNMNITAQTNCMKTDVASLQKNNQVMPHQNVSCKLTILS